MAKIRTLKEEMLAGGNSQEHVYPRTITKAVYSTDNTILQDNLDDIKTGKYLGDKTITERHLRDQSVATQKIKDGAITAEKLKDKDIVNSKLADNTITSTKLEPGLRSTIISTHDKAIELDKKKANITDVDYALEYLENKIGDRVVVEGNVTNLPDDEDLTSVSTIDGREVMRLNDRAYEPSNFSGKGYKILRKNIQRLNLPTVTIIVSYTPSYSGDITITINGKATTVSLDVATDTTTTIIATKIGTALKASLDDYDVSVSSSTTILTRNNSKSASPSSIDIGNTTAGISVKDSITKSERRNVLTQDMINEPNTVYEIRYDFELDNQEITIREGCTLKFNGGTISNGSIRGENTKIEYISHRFLRNINVSGTFNIETIFSSFFDNSKNNIYNNLIALTNDEINNTVYINDECEIVTSNIPKNILTSNTNLYFNANVTIDDNSQTNAVGIRVGYETKPVSNIYINGGGYHLKGNLNHDKYPEGQWAHGISISYAKNVKIENIYISECWGDGLEVDNSENVHINNVKCDSNRRQGFSIISGKNILLENSTGSNTGKIKVTLPGAGLDIEPNQGNVLTNVCVRNCSFFNNHRQESSTIPTDIQLYNIQYDIIDNVNIENCRCDGLWIGKTFNANIKNCDVKNGINVIDTTVKNVTLYNTHIPGLNSTVRAHKLFNYVDSYIAPYFYNRKNTYVSYKPYVKVTLKNAKSKYINIKWDVCGNYPNTVLSSYATYINDNTYGNKLINYNDSLNVNSHIRLTLFTKPKEIDGDIYFYIYAASVNSFMRMIINYEINSVFGLYNLEGFYSENILFEELDNIPSDEQITPLYNILQIGEAIHTAIPTNLLQTGNFLYDISLKKPVYWNAEDKTWYDSIGNNANAIRVGLFVDRPTSFINIGFPFLCIDKKAVNDNTNGLVIYYRGDNIWIDALGRVVDDDYPKATQGTTAQRPTNVQIGFQYYDTTLKKCIVWNGTEWTNMDGTALS